jgi:hypothetical protein
VWLLVEQDAVGLELRDREQQLVASGWEVVEQLALLVAVRMRMSSRVVSPSPTSRIIPAVPSIMRCLVGAPLRRAWSTGREQHG